MGRDCFSAAMPPARKRAASVSTLLLAGSVCVFAQAAAAPTAPQHEKLRNHFDSDILLRPPGFFDFLVLGAPAEANWKVTAASDSPSPPNRVTQVIAERPPDSIAVAVRRNAVFRDGTTSLALRKGMGRGGIVFRLAGEKNFRALLVDLSTGDARLTVYRDGRAAELAHGKAVLDNEWGVLWIGVSGKKIEARWNEKPLLEGTDPLPVSGRAGMATAGPGMVSFDEFILEPSDE
jgi:hypothetical protein